MKKRHLVLKGLKLFTTKFLEHFGVNGIVANLFSDVVFHHVVRPIINHYVKKRHVLHYCYKDKDGTFKTVGKKHEIPKDRKD